MNLLVFLYGICSVYGWMDSISLFWVVSKLHILIMGRQAEEYLPVIQSPFILWMFQPRRQALSGMYQSHY
jgi:hypothetical protein